MKTTRAMPSFNGVTEGATATLVMPIGLTYHGLLLLRGGTTFTNDHMTELRLLADGREIGVMSGSDLDDINLFNGLAAAGANLTYLDFERFGLKTRGAVELTAIGTGAPQNLDRETATGQPNPFYNPTPINTLQLQIDLAGTTAPTLSAKAVQSAAAPLGAILKRRRFFFNPTGSGDFEIPDLPRGDLIDKIWVKAAADNISRIRLDRDNFRVFDRLTTENDLIQSDGVRVPQTLWNVIDPSERGNGAESIVTAGVNDLRLILTMTGADALTVYVDYLGGLQGN